MRVIIAGSRELTDPKLVSSAVLESGLSVTEVVCGKARGIDLLGEQWAKNNHIPVIEFPADWNRYGPKAAGPVRNRQMAAYADALILIWDGQSAGSASMLKIARNTGLKIFEKRVAR